MKSKTRRVIGIGLLACIVGGLIVLGAKQMRSSSTISNGKISVVASYYPLYDFARAVGGDKIQAINITPAGAEPHDYEPAPPQLITAQKAQVFIYSGTTLEPWATKFLPDFTHTTVKASTNINLQAARDESNTVARDPHFWLDPVLAAQIVDNIQAGLAQADPAHASYYAVHAKAYKTQLAQLDADFRTGLASCQSRTVVTTHSAFGYLAARYKLDVVPIAGISPDQEPSAAKLASLAQIIKDQHIQYVFFEKLVSPRLADTLAKETGANTAVLDPIEGLTNEEQAQGKDYLSVQRANLAQLRIALACQ